MKALVVIGSRTEEDPYGVISGHRVNESLLKRGWKTHVIHSREGMELVEYLLSDRPDLVVPVGFGPPCEDGHVFALARVLGVPCAGPTPRSGSMMQDKAALANVVDRIFPVEAAVRAPRGCVLTRQLSDAEKERRVGQVAPPLLVKPNFSGSSEGLEIFDTHHEAIAAATSMLDREGRVLVQHLEQAVAEISCTVIDYLDGPMFCQ